MKIRWFIAILFVSVFVTGLLHAGSVYYWTDDNGVRHYSNTGIPNDVEAADVRPEEVPAPQASESSEISDTDREPPDTPPSEDETEQTEPDTEGEKRMNDRLAARAEKEKQRLESEIKKIKGLSIGKSFTQGMKDARIRPLQEQLALLQTDPERYFRMKRQGAFQSSSPSSSDPLADRLSSAPVASSTGGSSGDDNRDDAETPSP
ncbi:MAG: DUF4124 domain-containing protein [Desulfobacteraceae bacterium]|nr:DUF4124 domain-containing protein [Desulfobacteraceae bacterium]MBC2752547.1 DUF4124 domain-containing protein [Desulfobacteraceae bacterium]